MPEDHASLIERLEKAKGPNAELDALLRCALMAPAGSFVEQSELNGNWCIYDGRDTRGRKRLWESRDWWRSEGWPLTSSLDAALSLVERKLPGWVWKLSTDGDASAPDHKAHATLASEVWADPGAGMGVVTYGHAPTPALAVCLALLRALSRGNRAHPSSRIE